MKYPQFWADCKADAVAEVAGRAVRHFSSAQLGSAPSPACCNNTSPHLPGTVTAPIPCRQSNDLCSKGAFTNICRCIRCCCSEKDIYFLSSFYRCACVCVYVCVYRQHNS